MEIGNVYDSDENNKLSMEIVGLDVLSGLPKLFRFLVMKLDRQLKILLER